MNPAAQRVRDIFVAAVKLPAQQWQTFLKEVCACDEELCRRVEGLLQAHQQAGGFLDEPAAHVQLSDAVGPGANGAGTAVQEYPGTIIGPYRLLQCIGEGGMGDVWMAEQKGPVQRKVALKIIKAGMDTRQVVARFEAERQALALMDHPNIAKVFDGGATETGRPYFVMELVNGVPITTYCDEHRLTPRERLELFLPVCQAIQHAHTKGLIHRDIKPANILIAPYDGRPVPKVIDFGVAKATREPLTEHTLFTAFGALIGTLEYMSPEQAELNNHDIDTRSDIYGLGVLLYELLTGTTPLRHEQLKQAAFTEVLRLIREEDPPQPSRRLSESKDKLPLIAMQRHMEPAKLTRLVRGELDWIVMKALDKDRSRRYETASSLATDVQHYLAGEPVQAYPPTVRYRLCKFLCRRKGLMAAVVVVLLTLIMGIIGTTWGLVRAQHALSELQDQEAATRAAERGKTLQLAESRWREARFSRQSRQPGQRDRSLAALAEAVQHLRSLDEAELESRRFELRNDAIACLSLWDMRTVRSLAAVPRYPWPALDRTGEYYAAADAPSVVSWRRADDGHVVHRWQWEGGLCVGVKVSPDGRYVAALCREDLHSNNALARVWDSATGRLVLQRPVSHRCGHAFRPDSKVLALTGVDGSVALCDLAARRDLPSLPAGPMPQNLRFRPGSEYLAVSYSDHPDVDVWDTATRTVARRLVGERFTGGSLAWSPDGALLAVGSRDHSIYLCTFPAGNIHAVLRGHEHVVTRVEFHPAGQLLASDSHDDTTRLWRCAFGGELVSPELTIPGQRVVGFTADGRRLTTGCSQRITEWEPADPGDCVHYLPHGQGPSRGPWGIKFAPDGRLLASASQDGVVLWDAAAARLLNCLPSGDGYALAFHPKGGRLFTTGGGGLMEWPIMPTRVGPGTILRATSAAGRPPRVAIAGNGEALLVGAEDGGVDLVPLAEPAKVRRLGTHDSLPEVALSSDGRWAVSATSPGGPFHVWDVRQGILARRLAHEGEYAVATFSPDGRWLVTATRSEFCFWQVGSWERLTRLPRDSRSLFGSLAFTRDGRLLALVDGRNRIHLHDAATLPLRHLATLAIPAGPANLTGLSLSPDGARLAANTDYNVIILWDLRRLRQKLAALDLDWDMPPYEPARPTKETVQPLAVEVHGMATRQEAIGTGGKEKRPAPEEAKRILGLYNRYCIRCHGVDGRGVWDIPKVASFTDAKWQASHSDAAIARAILAGGTGTSEMQRESLKLPPPSRKAGVLHGAVMPSFRGVLTREEASGMARFLRIFAPAAESPAGAEKKPSK